MERVMFLFQLAACFSSGPLCDPVSLRVVLVPLLLPIRLAWLRKAGDGGRSSGQGPGPDYGLHSA